ncbi:MAG TPA: hypothetical protein VFR49_00525 [Solirubrobacteraceae bacterium]|nr:hypothetical protein [Solirubrobacteraceae bacterium]
MTRPVLRAAGAAAVLAAAALPAAFAAGGGNGLSLSPPLIEQPAKVGAIGSFKVANATGQPLRISVSARPWRQSADGSVAPDQRRTLPEIHLGASSFTLADGASQDVSLALTAVPGTGSVYGSYDVIAAPTQAPARHSAVTVEFRLVGSLRLDPVAPQLAAAASKVVVSGTRSHGELFLAVRNTGNTIQPIGGSVRVSGRSPALSSVLKPVAILPGATVNLAALGLHGSLPAGSYTLAATLRAGGKTLKQVRLHFTLR